MNEHNNDKYGIPVMILTMLIAGLLSTMNIWSDSIYDVRLSINDFYMSFLMISWSILLMGIIYLQFIYFLIGVILVIVFLYLIRSQLFVTPNQFINGMIPHHSMAITMSKKLLKNQKIEDEELKKLADLIIKQQKKEIELMKKIKKDNANK